jgi:hypothetical protein
LFEKALKQNRQLNYSSKARIHRQSVHQRSHSINNAAIMKNQNDGDGDGDGGGGGGDPNLPWSFDKKIVDRV